MEEGAFWGGRIFWGMGQGKAWEGGDFERKFVFGFRR